MSLFSSRRYHTMCFYGLILSFCAIGISGCGQTGPLIEPGKENSENNALQTQQNSTSDIITQ